ncbi:MAG: hypothetical protein ABI647_05350 [Gemmatimonadota bacterium]
MSALRLGSIVALGGQRSAAQARPYPSSLCFQRIAANGTTLHVRIGGKGPALVAGVYPFPTN